MKNLLLISLLFLFSCTNNEWSNEMNLHRGDVVSVKNASLKCNCIVRYYDHPAADIICEDDNKRLYQLEYVYIDLITVCDTCIDSESKAIPIEL